MSDWGDPIEVMEGYVDDVLNGDILTGLAVGGACKRHRTDLQRVGRDSFGYYFDEDHARNVCNFFPTVMRHSIGKNVGQPFILQPWQVFAIASIYGWKSKDDHTRRFRKAYISVGRKNGKSCLAAALCIYAAGYDYNPVSKCFESVAQIVLAASKKEQADRVTMAECIRMRQSSDVLKAASEHKNRQITFNHNDGHIITVGSDRAFDGLNPSVVQIDEMHSFRSSGSQKEFLDTMKTGSGARSQPLFLVTTTAGSTSSELWKSEWKYAVGVATGEYYDDSYFSLSYELDTDDDPLDPDLWIKANPCLGITLTMDYLEDQAKPARVDSVALNRFTRYHGNRLVSNLDSAFNIDLWDKSSGELSDFGAADSVGAGCDLGGRDDLAAWAIVSRWETDEFTEDEDGNRTPIYRYEAKVKSYIARDTERDLTVAPFNDFVDSGLLKVARHPISELERDMVDACRENGCYEVAFDPYNAQRTGEKMEEEGMEGVTMPQSTRYFNEPIVELRAAIAEGRFKHDGDPLLRWAMGNAVLISDRNDRVMYAKNECDDKIDPCVAMTMAFARAMAAPSKSNGYFTY